MRGYQFFRLQELEDFERWHAEMWLLRGTLESRFGDHLLFETHALLSLVSPSQLGASRIAVSRSGTFLPLEHRFTDSSRSDVAGSLDRLSLQIETAGTRTTIGRQAITWGVMYFWPSMDLFAPFAPQQIDREYKAGVDAARIVVPLGPFSELEVVGAALGPSAGRDGSAAALLRWNLGAADLGFMGGRFHCDSVAGMFLTANLRGSGLRGEVTWTDSGDPEDAVRARKRFWRGSVGLDRQLSPSTTLTAEVAWNGYGTSRASEYLSWRESDRVLRGEVNALGRVYSGVSVSWLTHPLLTLDNTILINANDPSSLWVPSLVWSTGNNSEVWIGGQIGMGEEPAQDGQMRSEYGSTPNLVFAAFQFFF